MKKLKFLLISLILSVLFIHPSFAAVKKATLIYPATERKVIVNVGSFQAQALLDVGYKLYKPGIDYSHLLGFGVITNYRTTLSASITSSQSTIPVSSIVTKDGHTITMADLGSIGFLVLEPGATSEELISFTGISGSSFTGVTRGLAYYGNTISTVAANRHAHQSGAVVIMSNVQYVYSEFVNLEDDQTVGGNKTFTGTTTFSVIPTEPTTTPTIASQVASKSYVDATVASGGVTAAEGTKGYVDLATRAQMASGASSGVGGSYLVLQSGYASSTSSSTNMIPVTDSSGKLNSNFINQTANYTWTGTSTFNGLTILNATSTMATTTFNGLTKVPTATPTVAGQVVGLDAGSKLPAIDGSQLTNIQTQTTFGVFNKDLSNANGATTTITHGLGLTPKLVKLSCEWGGSSQIVNISRGMYDGTNYASIAIKGDTSEVGDSSSSYIILVYGGSDKYQTATVTTLNSTTLVFTWAKTSNPTGTAYCLWEVN